MLMATPFLAGLAGTLITNTLPYGMASIVISVGAAILVIRLLKSPIAPAISAWSFARNAWRDKLVVSTFPSHWNRFFGWRLISSRQFLQQQLVHSRDSQPQTRSSHITPS
jgi:hypothetical protein